MKVTKAVIPAAGLGTRFLPATKAQPKEMLPIVDKPTIQYIIEEAVEAGIKDILIVIGKNKGSIEDHFDKSLLLEKILKDKENQQMLTLVQKISDLARIHYVRQKEPKGLGDAILCAKAFIHNEPFAVLLGDDVMVSEKPVIAQMMEVFSQYKYPLIGVQKVPESQVNKYGIVNYNDKKERIYQVNDLIEKPGIEDAPSQLAIMGRYIITPDIFPVLTKTKPGRKGEIQLTDALKSLLADNKIWGYNFKGKRYDVGDKVGFLKANVEFALRQKNLKNDFLSYLKNLVEDYEKNQISGK